MNMYVCVFVVLCVCVWCVFVQVFVLRVRFKDPLHLSFVCCL